MLAKRFDNIVCVIPTREYQGFSLSLIIHISLITHVCTCNAFLTMVHGRGSHGVEVEAPGARTECGTCPPPAPMH